uniref:glutathione transferase n=1 Tax=Lissorhoptrus oryzophilus TaxID=308863 RepID=A0A2R4FXC7_9CUCU|nr:glutathione S-transferase s4 [Lissorhoptrus oryzophilus]
MAPKYKLIYFNVAGAAEQIRYIFAYAGQEFEDFRIPFDQWPDIKKKTPFGKVPVLEVDGKPVPQSCAISRYLAKQFNLTGENEWEALQCDVLVDTYNDFKQNLVNWYREKDPAKKEEILKNTYEVEVPSYFSKFEKILSENHGFLVGSQVTWADLVFAANLNQLRNQKPGVLQPYPELEALVEKIKNYPKIKTYLENRPPFADPPSS